MSVVILMRSDIKLQPNDALMIRIDQLRHF